MRYSLINIKHILYPVISASIFGFVLFIVMFLGYIFIKSRKNEIIPLIVLSVTVLMYIFSDLLVFFLCSSGADRGVIDGVVLSRELMPLLAASGLLLMLKNILELPDRLKKTNDVLFIVSIAAAFLYLLLSYGDLFLTMADIVPEKYTTVLRSTGHLVPLMNFKNLFFTACLFYSGSVLLYAKMFNHIKFSVNKIIVSHFVIFYFTASYFFIYMFYSGFDLIYRIPYLGIGAAIFTFLISFEQIDVSYSVEQELSEIRNSMNLSMYNDTSLNLPNRNCFTEDLRCWFEGIDAISTGSGFFLLFIDIDDFTQINESFGEKVGNELLFMFSERITKHFSDKGVLYRVGGDDFVFWLSKIYSIDEVSYVASRMISSLRNPFYIGGVSYLITASIGIVNVPQDGDTVETILNNAYNVLHFVKRTKNTYRHFNKDMIDTTMNRIQMVNILRNSISFDQFTLNYQPVFDRNERIVYVETLLRCTNQNPLIGGPGNFIPVLEKAGLMKEVDDMVIRKAFNEMDVYLKDICDIGINLSTNQLINPGYCNFIAAFARQHKISPDQIILEVVEDTLIGNFAIGRENLNRLKTMGFKIAIDDFGKGYSSLSYLSELPVDVLKLDMAFVNAEPDNLKNRAIVSNIINMGHDLNLKIVGEGFESREQVDYFLDMGCDNFQGYFFSRPMAVDNIVVKYGRQS